MFVKTGLRIYLGQPVGQLCLDCGWFNEVILVIYQFESSKILSEVSCEEIENSPVQ